MLSPSTSAPGAGSQMAEVTGVSWGQAGNTRLSASSHQGQTINDAAKYTACREQGTRQIYCTYAYAAAWASGSGKPAGGCTCARCDLPSCELPLFLAAVSASGLILAGALLKQAHHSDRQSNLILYTLFDDDDHDPDGHDRLMPSASLTWMAGADVQSTVSQSTCGLKDL